MLESPRHHRFRSMECLGLYAAVTFCLSLLGVIERSAHSHPLVAWRTALVFQYPLATISCRFLGNFSISGTLDTLPRKLAQKRILPHRFIQFHCRCHSHLMRKEHLRTLFGFAFCAQLDSDSQSRRDFYFPARLPRFQSCA